MTRRTYAPSGRADLPALVPHALLLFCAAGLLAAGYAALVGQNAYAVGYVWLLPAGFKVWLVRGAVRDSHCRNAPLAAGLAAAAGLVTLLGAYHIDQCARWGVGWDRVDRLPGFVTFRMETDGWWAHDARMPLVWPLDPAAAPGVVPHVDPRVDPSLHWLAFACEAAALVVWPAGLAWAFARRPYSEPLRAWFQQEGAALTVASAEVLRAALTGDHVADWADRGVEKADPADAHVRLNVWYCPRPADGDGVEPEVYVTVGPDAPALLTPEEVAAVAGVFPALHD